MANDKDKKPRVFISYSWSPSAQKEWALGLAKNLMHHGVNVDFDQWNTSAGNDMNAYMESMILDKTIDKVIMVCNESYAKKADDREKGVGIETQIISEAVYKKTKQDKFIPIVSEVDDEGKPYLPIYCKMLRFIDMSDGRYPVGLEELLRAIYDEPLHPKPEVGSKPDFSSNKPLHPKPEVESKPDFSGNTMVETRISAIAQRACVSMRERNSNAADVVEECLSACIEEMEELFIEDNHPKEEVVVNRVSEFLPIRNDMVKVFQDMARYLPEESRGKLLHNFFEQMLIYYEPGRNVTEAFLPYKADHFKFLIHEMFLYAIAVLIKRKKFDTVAFLLEHEYYVPNPSRLQSMLPFSKIMVLLDIQRWEVNQDELPKQRIGSARSDALIKRATIRDLPLVDIQQADLVLAIWSARPINTASEPDNLWIPIVALYVESHHVFEIFARAQSERYFEEMKVLLRVNNHPEISEAMVRVYSYMSHRGWILPDISFAIGADKLCTRP